MHLEELNPTEIKDIVRDLKFWKRPAWEGGKVHTGFSTYVDEIWDPNKKEYYLNMELTKRLVKQKSLCNWAFPH